MKRRICFLVLALIMALCALPVTAGAAANDAASELYKATRRSYTSSRASYGKSFHGFCGTMVAYQLRQGKITKGVDKMDGNALYDHYKNKTSSSGGYYINPYSAKKYSLEEALNAISHNGTKDVYNILVGFQWTNTEAGAFFGHAVFINGILDGTVYFVESYTSAIAGSEGTVARVSISDFANYYDQWARFEGCIHFTKDYAESLSYWDTDLFVRARFDMQLRSQPCLIGQENCELLRSVSAGEMLRVTGILRNDAGQWYYQVQDGAYTGYVVAQATALEQECAEGVTLRELALPQTVASEEKLTLSGEVYSAHGRISTMEAVVTDVSGREVARVEQKGDKRTVSLSELKLPTLSDGSYTLRLWATVQAPYVAEAQLVESTVTTQLLEETFQVGTAPRVGSYGVVFAMAQKPNGWVRQNGTWYYYTEGQPYTGWLRDHGLHYYLDETGAVTTGWAQIDGQTCLFSDSGVLCTGWIRVDEGMRYCNKLGRFANGLQTIDGTLYCFEEGLLQTEGTVTDGREVYKIQPDGKATVLTEE